MNIEELLNRGRQIEVNNRNFNIDKILSGYTKQPLTTNQKFIGDIIDYLSTCINKDEFKPLFKIELNIHTCNCKQHIETNIAFKEFIKTLYSEYRSKPDLDISLIFNEDFTNEIKSYYEK